MIALSILLTVVACDQPRPEENWGMSEAEIRQIRKESAGMKEACLDALRSGGVAALPDRVEDCYAMQRVKRWRGLWRGDFELSRFCPAPMTECDFDTAGEGIWLTFGEKALSPASGRREGLHEIEFDGRRTLHKGPSGHLGNYDYEMVVDRVVSIRKIEPPPR